MKDNRKDGSYKMIYKKRIYNSIHQKSLTNCSSKLKTNYKIKPTINQ